MSGYEYFAKQLDDGVGRDRALDAEIYAFLQRECGRGRDARPSENAVGMVVVYYESGSHGTCSAPGYTSSLDDIRTAYALYGKGKEPDSMPFVPRRAMADMLRRIGS